VTAGGFISEQQIFKAIAMNNFGNGPLVQAVLMARSPLTAVMKANYFKQLAEEGKLPRTFASGYGETPDKFYIAAPELKEKFGERFKGLPWEAVGLHTYLSGRLGVGLMQLLAGARKWKLHLITRDDLMALSERAAKVTGLPLPEEADQEAVERILG
jgi:hypothetical protein